MFANAYQSGFISIFFSVGSNPLAIWDKQVKNGHIRRVIDDEVKSLVLDIGGTNVATTYITCPIKPRASLGVKLPYFVMVIKNMKKYFSFEIQILDDKDMRRRFRVSNFQSTTKVRPFCTTMPIGLSAGWNQVQFNLADFTKRAYGSTYIETVRVQIHANVRIRRIYFTDQLHSDEDLPNEFKLFAPRLRDKGKGKEKKPSKEESVQGEPFVSPIKTELRPGEEMPPPPSPAEESPIEKEELPDLPEYDATEKTQDVELMEGEPMEGEVTAEGEAVTAEEGAEGIKVEGEKTVEGEPSGEGEVPPAEGSEVEGDEAGQPGEEAAEVVTEEGAPPEGEGVPAAENEATVEGGATETADVPEGEAPPEQAAEDTVEGTVAETTDVEDTEASPSEAPVTENEEA